MSGRLGIDVGGTFTDLLLFDEAKRELHLLKTPSTPHDQSEGVLTGIEKIIRQSGIAAGERVCISPMAVVVEGMEVAIASESGADAGSMSNAKAGAPSESSGERGARVAAAPDPRS